MGIKITAPSNYTGASVYGDTVITFTNGVAEVESLNRSVGEWLKAKGYKITKATSKKNEENENEEKEEVNEDDGS